MRYKKSLLLGGFILGILIANLAVPYGGYVLVGGESMYPTIDKGCGIIAAESWDGESSLENEIVAFEVNNKESSINLYLYEKEIRWFAHRVIAEEKNYTINDSDYYIENITKDNFRLVYENGDEPIYVTRTNQEVSDLKELNGEHTFIAKGDNRYRLDAEIISADNVVGIINEDKYFKLQSLDTWPCSIIN